MNIFYIVAFLVGTGLGWFLCSLVDILKRYLEMKRYRKKSDETWASLRPYLEHCMTNNTEGGLVWLSYDELRERRKKQNEQNIQQQTVRRDSEETSGTP